MELIKLLITAALLGVGAYIAYMRNRISRPEGSALDGPIKFDELKGNSQKLAKLAHKVSSVGVIHTEVPGKRNSSYVTVYEAFVVDSNGVPNTFIKNESNHEVVLAKAQWLADELGVPLNNQAY